MRRALLLVIVAAAALVAVSVVVFAVALDLGALDAFYFTMTTVTTVGYGDISLREAPAAAKLFGIAVMIAGPAATAAGFGILTDFLLRSRLEELIGKRKDHMEDHIVLCGLGNVGVRVLERLVALQEKVMVVEREEAGRFVARARDLAVPVVIGDMRTAEALTRANIQHATSIVACTNDDLANLEAGLLARAERPTIRVVLRMFNQNLARRIEDSLGVTTALSTSILSAPAFAMAALDDTVVGSFELDGELMLNLRVELHATHPWVGRRVSEVASETGLTVLARHPEAGERQLPPEPATLLGEGDIVLGCVPAARRAEIARGSK